jgi:predicted nucleic acid-binding Zn finger protein
MNTVPLEALVHSAGVSYRVRELDGLMRCTCPWFARHQGERGPCKHVLAAQAALNLKPPEPPKTDAGN